MQAPPSTGVGGGGMGEWQAMQQQAPGMNQPQVPSQVPFQGPRGQFPFQGQRTQQYGGAVPPGYAGGGQYGGYPVGQGPGGTQGVPPAGGRGFPPPQRFMTPQQRQQLHQQVSSHNTGFSYSIPCLNKSPFSIFI